MNRTLESVGVARRMLISIIDEFFNFILVEWMNERKKLF